jgi:hypothetical protein
MRPLSERLDREWRQLTRRPAVLDRARGWGLIDPGEPPLASLDDLLARVGYWTPATAEADALLLRLVGVAATDPLAARLVLQRILPGLLAVVRAEQRRCPDVDAFDLLIVEAWTAIVSYRTDTRRTHVAARLLNDARHRAFTNPRRRRRVVEVPCSPDGMAGSAPPADPSPLEELVTLVAEARRHGLATRDVEVVGGLVSHSTAAQLARVLHVDARTVRYRRNHAVEQIRRFVGLPPASTDQNTGGRLAK